MVNAINFLRVLAPLFSSFQSSHNYPVLKESILLLILNFNHDKSCHFRYGWTVSRF